MFRFYLFCLYTLGSCFKAYGKLCSSTVHTFDSMLLHGQETNKQNMPGKLSSRKCEHVTSHVTSCNTNFDHKYSRITTRNTHNANVFKNIYIYLFKKWRYVCYVLHFAWICHYICSYKVLRVVLRVVTCSNFIQVDANFSLNQYALSVPSIISFPKHFGYGVRSTWSDWAICP